ncbi:DUF3592 domain-containing protein [Reyranella sp.]|uniref:DUF3592 domain-containing protein n=1 Tax=Reyranella sp. TaxID=1929291 RepID=UPI003D0C4618
MRYVVGLMMVAFFLGGVGLFAVGVRELTRRFGARRRLRSAEGEIVRIEKRQEIMDSDSGRTADFDYPEIRFRTGSGGDKTFISEIGAGARTARYAIGQKLTVLYDPDGELPPMIDSWAAIWMPNLIRTIAGPIFIFGALFIY